MAGRYSEAGGGSGVNCGGGRQLYYRGGEFGQFDLTQEASTLTIKGAIDIKGTLHDDLTATFGPFPAIAISTGGGIADDSPGKVTLTGRFTSTNPPMFEGNYEFTAFIDSCKLPGPTTWTLAK